jgi:nucleoside-diphosphate-sugar epimerase
VGSAIVKRLAYDGVELTVALRGDAGETIVGHSHRERRWPSFAGVAWNEALAGVDVIVHAAARTHILGPMAEDDGAFRRTNVDLTLAIARGAAAAGVRRFIYLSSAHVNGTRTIDAPFRANDRPRPANAYARSKWCAEQELTAIARETGLEVVTIRPPLVIGREPKGNLGNLVAAIRRGLPLPLGAVTRNRRDLVSLNTLADLVAKTIDHPAAPGVPLMVSDGHALSTRGIIQRLAALHGLAPRLVPIPPALLGATLGLLGRKRLSMQLLGDLEIDISETCRRLDWQPSQGATA